MLRTGLIAAILIMVTCVSAQAVVTQNSPFESSAGEGTWITSVPGGTNAIPNCGSQGLCIDQVVKLTGTGSLRYTFPSSCLHPTPCGGFYDKSFSGGGTTNWEKFDLFVDPNFVISTPATKIIQVQTTTLYSDWFGMQPSPDAAVSSQTATFQVSMQRICTSQSPTLCEWTENLNSVSVPKGQSVCIEVQTVLSNPPGTNNGAVHIYTNGTLRSSRTGLINRGASSLPNGTGGNPDNGVFALTRVYRQLGSGTFRIDNLTQSTTRNPCGGGTQDTTPPGVPTGLAVH